MEPKKTEPVRLNVDEETKRFLEAITDRLADAMIDFVKRDDLKEGIQEVKVHLSAVVRIRSGNPPMTPSGGGAKDEATTLRRKRPAMPWVSTRRCGWRASLGF